jgi:apolipoprotein N-acyltransferase
MRQPGREVRGRWGHRGLAVAAGSALGASFVDFRLWALPWLAVAPLIAIAESETPRRAWRLGWLAGCAGIAIAFTWLIHAFEVFGGFSRPAAYALFVPPVAWMGLEIGVFTALLAWGGRWPLGLAAPVTYTTVELVFPTLFPWRLAHTQNALLPLIQTADVAGPHLLGFAIVWVNAGLVALARDRARTPLATALGLVGVLALFGSYRLHAVEGLRQSAPPLRVGVVQGNVGVERKGDRAFFRRNLEDYRRLSRAIADSVDLLVWPETVAQRPIAVDAGVPSADVHPFPDPPRPLVFGGLAVAESVRGRRLYNSAFLLDATGAVAGRYDKRILVPFGEYLPMAERFPWLRRLSPATGRFSPGTDARILTTDGGARLGPLICYEDVVPEPARRAVRLGAQLLLNLTNDAWYGDTAEPHQHQALALWRAVETRRDFIRSTNTGLTTAIAATGAVLSALPTFTAATMVVEVRLLGGPTFYATWGDVFAGVIALAWALTASGRVALRRWRLARRKPGGAGVAPTLP